MHHFAYRDRVLHAEAVNLAALADIVGTPFYCYSSATIERHYNVFAAAFADVDALVCYALKANSNQAVVTTLARLGAGADVVSEGELLRALTAGVPPQRTVFSGVGKTPRELALAVEHGILCVNVESESELELLSSIATAKARTADISIRVNPDVDPKTHAKIATGKAENKFGIPISRAAEVYARAAKLKGVRAILTAADIPELHIGMHAGRAIYSAGDYIGTTVNTASRVTSASAPGETLMTETVADQLNGAETAEPVGVRMLRGVESPVRLFRLVAREEQRDPVCREMVAAPPAARLQQGATELWFCSQHCLRRFLLGEAA